MSNSLHLKLFLILVLVILSVKVTWRGKRKSLQA